MADYTRNKNLWRKTIGYGAQPTPILSTSADLTEVNLHNVYRHRDLYLIAIESRGVLSTSFVTSSYGEYDEDVVSFAYSDGTYKSFNFNFSFSNNPIVVLSIDRDNDSTNVIPFGITYSTTGAYVGVSAPFTGTLRYRAIYNATYPTTVTSAFTGSNIEASAGTVTVSANATEYYSIYDALSTAPSEVYQTAWDSSDHTSNIYIDDVAVTNSSISSSLSAPYSKEIHFIVIV